MHTAKLDRFDKSHVELVKLFAPKSTLILINKGQCPLLLLLKLRFILNIILIILNLLLGGVPQVLSQVKVLYYSIICTDYQVMGKLKPILTHFGTKMGYTQGRSPRDELSFTFTPVAN